MSANVQAMPSSFKSELLKGTHALGTQSANSVRTVTTADVVKAALFVTNNSMGAATTAYSTTGEVTGTGYTAGGVTVTNATAPSVSGTGALWTPSASIVYPTVTLTTAFDTVLLYNASSTGSLAIGVYTFGAQTVTAGTFTLTMPANTTGNALVQIN
jgi:hypothetical protein